MSSELNQTIDERGVATLTLNREAKRNAFDPPLIEALDQAFERLGGDDSVRVVILTGAGRSFSAGADLEYMRKTIELDRAANIEDAERLAAMLRHLAFLSKPTIARVNGHAIGGGLGLVACCDIAIAAEGASFGLSEVRLGLIPAVISPYVQAAIGRRAMQRYALSGELFRADQAREIGLVHTVASLSELDQAVADQVDALVAAGPEAVTECKRLLWLVDGHSEAAQQRLDKETAQRIADLRVGDEAQDGIRAFLDRRPPRWRP